MLERNVRRAALAGLRISISNVDDADAPFPDTSSFSGCFPISSLPTSKASCTFAASSGSSFRATGVSSSTGLSLAFNTSTAPSPFRASGSVASQSASTSGPGGAHSFSANPLRTPVTYTSFLPSRSATGTPRNPYPYASPANAVPFTNSVDAPFSSASATRAAGTSTAAYAPAISPSSCPASFASFFSHAASFPSSPVSFSPAFGGAASRSSRCFANTASQRNGRLPATSSGEMTSQSRTTTSACTAGLAAPLD